MLRFLLIGFLGVMTISCKHSSIDDVPAPVPYKDTLLKRMFSRYGTTDSTEILYTYNALGKPILKMGKYVSATINQRDSTLYSWDATGRFMGITIHTITPWTSHKAIHEFHYHSGGSLAYMIERQFSSNGSLVVQDSTVYFFNTNGIDSGIVYERYPNNPYKRYAKYEWKTVNGNVDSIVYYEWDVNQQAIVLKTTTLLEFDDKINPIRIPIDVAIPYYNYYFNRNNVVKMTTIYNGEPFQRIANTVSQYYPSGHPSKRVTTTNYGTGSDIDYYY